MPLTEAFVNSINTQTYFYRLFAFKLVGDGIYLNNQCVSGQLLTGQIKKPQCKFQFSHCSGFASTTLC